MKDASFGLEVPPVPSIPISHIDVGDNRRRADPDQIAFLSADFDMQGQLQPILVVERNDRFVLVDGLQRLEAAKDQRWKLIEARVLPQETTEAEADYARIMANLNRKSLTKLERAVALAELQVVLKSLNPSARRGGDRRSAQVREIREKNQTGILALCSELVERLEISERSFYRAISINSNISAEIKDRIYGTWLENHQSGLLALAEQPSDTQIAVCDLLFADPPKAASVADALVLAQGEELQPHSEKLLNRFDSTWGRLSKTDREQWVIVHFDAISEIIKSKGLPI